MADDALISSCCAKDGNKVREMGGGHSESAF